MSQNETVQKQHINTFTEPNEVSTFELCLLQAWKYYKILLSANDDILGVCLSL